AWARSFLTDLADIQMDARSMRFVMSKPNVYNVSNIANVLAIIPKHVLTLKGCSIALVTRTSLGLKERAIRKSRSSLISSTLMPQIEPRLEQVHTSSKDGTAVESWSLREMRTTGSRNPI